MRLDQLEFASGKARSAWQLRGSRGAVVTLYHAQRQRLEDVSALLQSLASHVPPQPLYFGDHPVEEALATFQQGDRQFTWSPQTSLETSLRRLRKAEEAEWSPVRPAAPQPLDLWDLTQPDATHQKLVQHLTSRDDRSTSVASPDREERVTRSTYEHWLEQATLAAEEWAELTTLRDNQRRARQDAEQHLDQQIQAKEVELTQARKEWRESQAEEATKRQQLAERQQQERQRQFELRNSDQARDADSSRDAIPAGVRQLWTELAFIDQRLSGWRGLQSRVEAALADARSEIEAITLQADPDTESRLKVIRLELRQFESIAEAVIQKSSKIEAEGDPAQTHTTTLDVKKQCGDLYHQLHALYDRLTHQCVGLARKTVTQKMRHLRRLNLDLAQRAKAWLERRKRCLEALADAGVDTVCLSERSQQGFCRCAKQDGYDACGTPKMKPGASPEREASDRHHLLADLTQLSFECRRLQEELLALQLSSESKADRYETLAAELQQIRRQRLIESPGQEDAEVAAKLMEVQERRNSLLQRISQFEDQECTDQAAPFVAWSPWLRSLSSGQWLRVELDTQHSRIRVQRRNQVWYSWSELDPQSKSLILFGLALGSVAEQEPTLLRWPTVIVGPERCGQQGHRWGGTLSALADETAGQLWLLTSDESWASRCNLGETQQSIPDWRLLPETHPAPDAESLATVRRVIVQRSNNSDAEEFPGEFRDQVIGRIQLEDSLGDWTRAESVEAYETHLAPGFDIDELPPDAWATRWLENSDAHEQATFERPDWSTMAIADDNPMNLKLRTYLVQQGVETWGELAELSDETAASDAAISDQEDLKHWKAVAELLVSGQVRSVFDARVLVACRISHPAQLTGGSCEDLARRIQGLRQERTGREILDQGSDEELLNLSSWVASLGHSQALQEFGYQDRQALTESDEEPSVGAEAATEAPRATIRFDAAHGKRGPSKRRRHLLRRGVAEKLTFYLSLSDDLEAAPAIGPKTAGYFAEIGIITVRDFLESDPTETAERLDQSRIDEELIHAWQQQAELVCRVPNLRGHDAQLLVACDVTTADELATWQPDELFAIIGPFSESPKGQRILRSGREPDLAEVTDWIRWAQEMRSLHAA